MMESSRVSQTHNALNAYPYSYGGSHHQTPPAKRRKRDHANRGGPERDAAYARLCPHCGRTFKRTEHLERHVRTHTKEKPYICHCGAAFARRDLLARHERLKDHVNHMPSESPVRQPAEADLAAAVSLSGLSGLSSNPWPNHHLQQQHGTLHVDHDHQHHEQPGGVPHPGRQAYSQELLSSQLFTNDAPSFDAQGVTFETDTQFAEFANFLDGVGLPAVWSPFFQIPSRECEAGDASTRQQPHDTPSPKPAGARSGPGTRPGTPFSSWLPSAPTGNKISTNNTENQPTKNDPEVQRFRVTEDQRGRLLACLDTFSKVTNSDFKLPSRHALTRYINSFFSGFHSHMPFIHCRTWQVLDHPVELILGICAVGAQYCFEHRMSERLFFTGKAIAIERLVQNHEALGPRTSSFLALNGTNAQCGVQERETADWKPIETVRALIALMGYASWEPKTSMVREAFALQGLLSHILRDIGLDEDQESESLLPPEPCSPIPDSQALHAAWLEWVHQESQRRSKLIAFSFLHTHSVAYNVYPLLRSNEVRLRLPCSTKEWKAATAAQWWTAAQEVKKQQHYFQNALSLLLKNNGNGGAAPLDPIPTPLGNYVLLHGLLQRIHIVRDLNLPIMGDSAALPTEEVDKLERGLRSWTSGWQQAAESSLDPNNENGPIPFTSSSLLALAYVRIHMHLGPCRQLETRDPDRIAKALGQSPSVERSDGIIAALLYAVHMLSIPVKLGVDRVARSQAFFWSVRHSLSSLECSIFLSKWLRRLGDTVPAMPLSDSENRILHWVRSIVEEAYMVVDFEDEDDSLLNFQDARMLGIAVLNIWAYFFKSNTQWPFINIIGLGLEQYRDNAIKEL